LNDNVGWLPLHWALACGNMVTEEDVKTIYAADPMALSTRHLLDPVLHGHDPGFTPLSLLLMAKKPNMSLLLFFLKTHSQALTVPVGGFEQECHDTNPLYLLHFAAEYSESIEVLQMLLQVDTGVTSIRVGPEEPYEGEFPLGLLCRREEFPGFWDMVSCLLKEDSSDEVIVNAISCVITAKGLNTLPLIEMLLKANPEAAKEEFLLHEICEHIKGDFCIKILSLFIAIDKDAIQNADVCPADHQLPIHYAAECNSLEVLEFLLSEYPESALKLSHNDRNLLYIALQDTDNEIDVIEAKVKLLVSKYPILLRMHCQWGLTPLQSYLLLHDNLSMKVVSLIAVDKDVVAQGASECSRNLGDNYYESLNHHLSLPLHLIMKSSDLLFPLSPAVSETADIIRHLINIYPEAISVKNAHEKCPYDYAVEKKLDPYFIRILLRGDPTINPTLLYDLNYAERRLAMFVSFRAVTRNTKVSIWANLRFENKDLLKKVISFL
jgi:hypothetical protein